MEWNIDKTTLFIEDYHNSPELWNNKISDYKDNRIKNDKLKQLASKYDCTVIDVKKKIKNLRSAFHRERKKMQSKKSGSSPSKKGKWFAFELLSFLLDVDQPRSTLSTAFVDEEDFEEEEVQEDSRNTRDIQAEVNEPRNQQKSEKFIALKKSRKRLSPSNREKEAYSILKNACQRDDCSTYGDHVANELRNLNSRARTIVKHIINNTLFEAALGKYDAETSTPLYNNYESNSCTVLSSVTSASSDCDY